jgi:hypothetical protein
MVSSFTIHGNYVVWWEGIDVVVVIVVGVSRPGGPWADE